MQTMAAAVGASLLPSTYFSFKVFDSGTDAPKEKQVLALRYQIYCREMGFLPADKYPDHLECDEYDAFSTHIAACNQHGAVVGSLRAVKPPLGVPFPFQKYCHRLFADKVAPPRHKCSEISRLVVSKSYRHRIDDTILGISSHLVDDPAPLPVQTQYENVDRSLAERRRERRKHEPDILLGLIRHLYRYSKRHGVAYWYMAVDRSLARLLTNIFHFVLDPIGEQTDHNGTVTPYLLSLSRLEKDLVAADPEMFAWLQISGEH
ncbi:MAG: PEP-CTERM/exosortase system-associated acyltransferase [Candidatus Methylumidiphilus sp.]